jgi:polyhydroxybutyrate depolymerase
VTEPPARAARRVLAAFAVLLTLLVCGCGTGAQHAVAPAEAPVGFVADSVTLRTADGRERSYIVYAPAHAGRAMPLMLVFHGAGGTAAQTTRETDFVNIAAQRGLIVAFLQGYQDTWNEGAGHTPARVAGVDDVAFTAAVLSQIEHRYAIDRTRVAAVGFSNGALLSQLLGCQLSDRLTLVAPVSGPLPVSVAASCRPPRTISVLETHGTADRAIPYVGGRFFGIGGGTTVLSAPASAARWASLNGCKRRRQTSESSGATVLTTYSACRDRVVVQLRSLEGAGHGWPPNIGVLVADFLLRHPRTATG